MKWIVIGALCASGVLLWLIGKWVEKMFTFRPPAPPPPVATTATTGTPAPPPPPPPPTASKSYGWVWSFIFVFFGGLIALTIYHKALVPVFNAPGPQPQSTAPKILLQQKVEKCTLQFVGGDGVLEKGGLIEVPSDKQAFFATHSLPWKKNAAFHVVVNLLRKSTGQICLEVNGGRGGTKSYMHPGSPELSIVVFFEKDERGDSGYFNPGANQIKIWSPGDDIFIQNVRIEMIERFYSE